MTEHSADTVELKPCPFCAGQAEYIKDHTTECCDWIICNSCYVTVSDPDHQGSCISSWNTRAALSALTVEDAAKVLLEAGIERRLAKSPAFFLHFHAWEGYKQGVKDYTAALRAIADTPKEGE